MVWRGKRRAASVCYRYPIHSHEELRWARIMPRCLGRGDWLVVRACVRVWVVVGAPVRQPSGLCTGCLQPCLAPPPFFSPFPGTNRQPACRVPCPATSSAALQAPPPPPPPPLTTDHRFSSSPFPPSLPPPPLLLLLLPSSTPQFVHPTCTPGSSLCCSPPSFLHYLFSPAPPV